MLNENEELSAQEREAQIIRRGVASSELLSNEAFREVMSDLAEVYVQTITLSAPNEGDKREAAYHQHVALQSIIGVLEDRVQQMNSLEENDDDGGLLDAFEDYEGE